MIDLEKLDALHAAATPGELQSAGHRLSHSKNTSIHLSIEHIDEIGQPRYWTPYQAIPFARQEDATWHAALHNAYPALSKELRELREQVEYLAAQRDGVELSRALWQKLHADVTAERDNALQFMDAFDKLQTSLYDAFGQPNDHQVHEIVDRIKAERKQLIADNDRLRRALGDAKKNACEACLGASFGSARDLPMILDSARITADICETALSASPPDAVKRFEARIRAEAYGDAAQLALNKKNVKVLYAVELNELAEAARKEAVDAPLEKN